MKAEVNCRHEEGLRRREIKRLTLRSATPSTQNTGSSAHNIIQGSSGKRYAILVRYVGTTLIGIEFGAGIFPYANFVPRQLARFVLSLCHKGKKIEWLLLPRPVIQQMSIIFSSMATIGTQ